MMKLWTPPKLTPARPHVCGVCGGMLPEWVKEHRRRGGFILLSACCCRHTIAERKIHTGGVRAGTASVWTLSESGSPLWTYDTGNTVLDVAVDSGGNVIVGGVRVGSASVWKLDANGSLLWTYDTGSHVWGVDVDADDNIAVSGSLSGSKNLWKLDADGSLVWSFLADSGDSQSTNMLDVAFGEDGNIYTTGREVGVGLHRANVWKVAASGSLLWRKVVFSDAGSSYASNGQVVAADEFGNIYLGTEAVSIPDAVYSSVYKITPDSGSTIWPFYTGSSAVGISVDDVGNAVVHGLSERRCVGPGGPPGDCPLETLLRLNFFGGLVWAANTGNVTVDSAVDGDGNIYVMGSQSTIYSSSNVFKYDALGGLVWHYNTGSSTMRAVALGLPA